MCAASAFVVAVERLQGGKDRRMSCNSSFGKCFWASENIELVLLTSRCLLDHQKT
jgi:hypothetical protein